MRIHDWHDWAGRWGAMGLVRVTHEIAYGSKEAVISRD